MRVIDKDSIKILHEKSADNLILIDKPESWSSFDVVKKVRYLTRIKKVGHGGTLDPFATGLLILGTGKETKICPRSAIPQRSILLPLNSVKRPIHLTLQEIS